MLENICGNSILLLVVTLRNVLLQVDVHADYFLYLSESQPAHLLQWIEECKREEHAQSKKSASADKLSAKHTEVTGVNDSLLLIEDAK